MKVLLFLTVIILILTILTIYLYMIYFNIKNYKFFSLKIKIINITLTIMCLPFVIFINHYFIEFFNFIIYNL